MAQKGVEGLLKHIFQGVKRNALETAPEELERALIRYDRKTEMIQADREKSNNKERHEIVNRPSSCPERKTNQRWKPGEDRGEKK